MASFGGDLLILFGLLSMGLAGAFILRQADYKRMLAYSSVEHMGILAVGVGLGGLGLFGSFLHAVNHSIVKAMLFLTAGNILSRFHTKDTMKIQGACDALPISGALWIAGFLAVTGSPPFGTFISEFTILRAVLDQGRWVTAVLYVLFLLLAFVGMAGIVLRMALGKSEVNRVREPLTAVLPPIVFAVLALLLGVYLPGPLADRLHEAAQLLGGMAK
jgi:hydrogenase-4 component F